METVVTIRIKDRDIDVEFVGDVVTVTTFTAMKRVLRHKYRKQLRKGQREFREKEKEQLNANDSGRTETVRSSLEGRGEGEGVDGSKRAVGSVEGLREQRSSNAGDSQAEERESKREVEGNGGSVETKTEPVASEQVKTLLSTRGHGTRKPEPR